MGPDELDDLLASIRAEGKKETALALYEGTREDDLVEEQVDEKILEILGLEYVHDFTYGEYKQLLFDALQKVNRGEDKSTDRAMLLQKEFKRVKNKVGRFTFKPVSKNIGGIAKTGPIRVNKNKFFLADKVKSVDAPEVEKKSPFDPKSFVAIGKTLDRIIKLLEKQESEKRKALEKERRRKEREARKLRESLLEKASGFVKSLAQKILEPVKSIWDKLMNFISNVIMGVIATRLFRWLSDPKNEQKIKSIARFLKDWWPALAFAAGLFLTPLGKFIRTTITFLRSWVPKIAGFLLRNPWLAAAAGLAAIAATANEVTGQRQAAPIQADNAARAQTGRGISVQGTDTMFDKTPSPGSMKPATPYGISVQGARGGGKIKKRGSGGKEVHVNDIAFEGGGGIDKDTGLKVKGAGADTQLIAARPGEIMISKEAVDKYGANFFLGLNKSGGGTNSPKMVNNIQLARGGGMVGGGNASPATSSSGGVLSGFGKLFGMFSGKSPALPKPKKPIPTPEYKNPLVKSALKTLRFTEGTNLNKNAYDTVFGGETMPVTKMTVNELINTQMTDMMPKRFGGGRAPFASGSVASGAYQFMPHTLRQLITMRVLKPTDLMTPDNQDKAGWALMKNRGVTLQTLKKHGFNRVTQDMLSGEWASVPTMSGESAYGQSVKPSSKIQDFYKKSLNSPQASLPSQPFNRVNYIELPPKFESIASGKKMPQAVAQGTSIPVLSSEDPNFSYSKSRSFYMGIHDESVA